MMSDQWHPSSVDWEILIQQKGGEIRVTAFNQNFSGEYILAKGIGALVRSLERLEKTDGAPKVP